MTGIVLMGDARVSAVPVQECGDELVDVRTVPDLAFMSLDENPQRSRAYSFLRHGLVQRLLDAQEALPVGYRLLLSEGYRPYDLQDFYFTGYRVCWPPTRPSLPTMPHRWTPTARATSRPRTSHPRRARTERSSRRR